MDSIRLSGSTIMLVGLLSLFFHLQAQQTAPIVHAKFEGVVTDSITGRPIEGANVQLETVTHRVKTDPDGHFQFVTGQKFPVQITVSYLGYKTKTVTLSQSPIIIALQRAEEELDAVVVVGYGRQKRKNFIGSVSTIEGGALVDRPVQSFDQALMGQAPGVSVALPNGQLNSPPVIRIRGVNSISLNASPLIVIDGVPVTSGQVSSTRASNNPLADINPNDIESISVLKDAASTSIYGSRAAGGVILVTTKRGKQGSTNVNYDGWVSIANAMRIPKVLNAEQYTTIKNESIANASAIDGISRTPVYFLSSLTDGSIVDTDWKSYVYRTGFSHNHTVNVSGGSEKVNYYISANATDQSGFLVGNDFDRKGLRFNLDNQTTAWLKLSAGGSYSNSNNQSFDSGSLPGASMTTTGSTRLALVLPPNIPAYNEDGSYHLNPNSGTLGSGQNKTTIPLYNPVSIFDLSRNHSNNSHFLGNFSATLKPIEKLSLTSLYAVDRIDVQDEAYRSPLLGSEAYTTGGAVTNTSVIRLNQIWTNTAQYNTVIGSEQAFNVLVGFDIQRNKLSSWGARATQASDDFFTYYQGGWGSVVAAGNNRGERVYASFFSRLNYELADKYLLTVNYRRDGNSALALGRKYGDFGGVAVGWLLSDETFFRNSSLARLFSDVKVNASWGRVGNGNLANDYSSYDLYSSSLYGNVGTWGISQQGNPMLSWETSDQTNVGLTFSTWKQRLKFELAYFKNNVNNLILNTPQSLSKGIPGNTILANVGSMYNRGFELGVNADILAEGNFTWNAGFNLSALRNEVTALADGNADIIGATGTGNTNVTRVGYAVGSLYGLKTIGVNPENGQRIFMNAKGEEVQYNGLGKWTYLDGGNAASLSGNDFYLLGNTLPKWYGGFNNRLAYKNVELVLNFTYAGGHYVMNRTRSTLTDQIFFNNSTEILDRWTTPGQQTNVPRVVSGDRISFGGSTPISEHVEKANFLRLQQAQLSYLLPAPLLDVLKFNKVRFFVQVNNAFLWTNYTGIDPEVSSNGDSNVAPGVEYNTAGLGRTFTFGLNLTF
ncbi:SusC/RagA family TonB-linked outer membrane protein [Sphingobacterium bambusae]|uniref:SusC/RagA family TonB-linked outer membrane protein n=1 Tax=Sphingobacterium bambusae TaxID=662858 RepID=A0ABW6B8M2_9SPHI|nr:SusC/RagA family TonB-linked outer membrane protein [Sphingobacterium bambusae]WPL49135.1 SusC/RagA family TonB-linked outer membrane protein [Sphingobacterium bambusae]